jgi:hypothetical protein
MSEEQPPSGQAALPQPFGPVRQQLSDHREDHERGWQEEVLEAPLGPIPRVGEPPRVTLAEQFRRRLRQADADGAGER